MLDVKCIIACGVFVWVCVGSHVRISRPQSCWHLARMAQERVCVAMAMMEKLNLCLPHPQPGRFQAIGISFTKRALSSRKESLKAAPSWVNHLNASLWLKITNMSWKMWQPTKFSSARQSQVYIYTVYTYGTLWLQQSVRIMGLRRDTSMRYSS